MTFFIRAAWVMESLNWRSDMEAAAPRSGMRIVGLLPDGRTNHDRVKAVDPPAPNGSVSPTSPGHRSPESHTKGSDIPDVP